MRRRGASLVEVVVAIMVLATVVIAYLSVAGTATRSASQSRNYALATVVAQNAIEEISAHPYGQPLPEDWQDLSPFMVIDGRESQVKFKLSIEPILDEGGNGSFFGGVYGNVDVLKVTVSWQEPQPSDISSREQEISFRLTVRRKDAVF